MVEKLGDICAVDWGNTALTKKSYVDGGEYLAVSATGGDGRLNHYEHEASVCVLSAIGAQCGKMFFPQQRFTAIKNTITLTPKADKVVSKFLYYLFTAIELPKRGAAQPFISKGDIQNFKVPFLPPLAEQQRIVAKLDAAFAEIDTAIEVAEAKEAEVEKLKASLLSASLSADAVMWETTPFEKCLEKTKVPHKLPKKEYLKSGTFPVVSQEATLISGYHNEQVHVFNVSKPVTIFGDHTQVLKYVDFDFVVGADGVKILLPIEEIDTKYFYYLLQALMPKGNGYARHYKLLKQLNISYPPLAEQQCIVAKLDTAFAEIDNAKQAIQRAKENHAALKAAILAQELTPPTESEAA
jgi:restriction endonuclease S subunit